MATEKKTPEALDVSGNLLGEADVLLDRMVVATALMAAARISP